ncbi:Multisubstrate pseudouridine synthase 7 [Beauveria bassiana D1-5]|uniref:Multisubstrate pseudouridine synthase 7 n=1 Tax=Beauveria bassiana D1-5 TaxID=1245745 RepID=A0A0A2VQZ6_BEABA|nr:Multisubstrate pseudouridine synthase 7 [Beauveria bassiana D1-5]
MAEPARYHARARDSTGFLLGWRNESSVSSLTFGASTGELTHTGFSDFQVNEIGLDGEVVHLKTIGLTEEQKKAEGVTDKEESEAKPAETKPAEEESEKPKPPAKVIEVAPEDVKILTDLAGEKFAQELVDMFREAQTADPEQRVKPISSDPIDEKHTRGQIHQEVRRIFQSRIDTSTDSSGGIVATAIRDRPRGKKRNRGGAQQRDNNRERKDNRPAAEYLHFTLYKDNRDTMDAVTQIARMIRSKPQSIGYAGTKDRRASTAQRCSIRYTHQRSLAGLNGNLWGITTGNYEYRDEGIHLGQLLGNEFVITLKNCKVVDESGGDSAKPLAEQLELLKSNVGTALEHMAAHGWINYFGHQRFGTHHIGTHEIGKLILGDKYEEALNALLTYDPELAAKYETAAAAARRKQQDQHGGARASPRVHAVPHRQGPPKGGQHDAAPLRRRGSHVWNHAASMRWERHGSSVVAGDLVIADDDATPLHGGKDQDGDDIINPVADDDDGAPVRARPLTAEEAASGRYTIHDVVLPTPGYQVAYPENDIGAFYAEFMGRAENGGLDPRKMMRMRREFSLPGRYRKVMNRFLAPPSIEFRTYIDDKEQMHPTDLDVLKAAAEKTSDEGPAAKKTKVEEGEAAEPAEEKIAAIVKFQLGRSAYATVTLRELMGDMQEES